MRKLRPAPLAAYLIEPGDEILVDPAPERPHRYLGTAISVEDKRGTLSIYVRTSPASTYTITTTDYDRPVWVHVPTGQI